MRSQQLDIYREIARSQQQIMTVYKYLVTEYIHELDIPQLTSKMINSMLENFDPYTEYYEEKDLEDLNIKTTGEFSGVGLEDIAEHPAVEGETECLIADGSMPERAGEAVPREEQQLLHHRPNRRP